MPNRKRLLQKLLVKITEDASFEHFAQVIKRAQFIDGHKSIYSSNTYHRSTTTNTFFFDFLFIFQT